MTVLLRDPTRVSVALTGEDMARLGITYESLDPRAAGTRRAILAVFDEACRRSGGPPRVDGGFLVETIPGRRSGCILIFSAREAGETRYFCRVRDADAFLDCLALLQGKCAPDGAFYYRGEYYLYFRGAPDAVFTEYGEVCADRAGRTRARLAEFGEPLNIG